MLTQLLLTCSFFFRELTLVGGQKYAFFGLPSLTLAGQNGELEASASQQRLTVTKTFAAAFPTPQGRSQPQPAPRR